MVVSEGLTIEPLKLEFILFRENFILFLIGR